MLPAHILYSKYGKKQGHDCSFYRLQMQRKSKEKKVKGGILQEQHKLTP
jgi:hypothetical protein